MAAMAALQSSFASFPLSSNSLLGQRFSSPSLVHRVLVDIVSAATNGTPGLGRYPPFKREGVAIASAALDGFKNEAKNMVVALVDMERAFVPVQHFIRLVQRRLDTPKKQEERHFHGVITLELHRNRATLTDEQLEVHTISAWKEGKSQQYREAVRAAQLMFGRPLIW